jgi:hypothetical protein
VLAAGEEGEAVVVLMRPDATADGIVEIRRVLQRPLVTRRSAPRSSRTSSPRAYNQGSAASNAMLVGDLARENDLARLMQDMPATRTCSTARRRRR